MTPPFTLVSTKKCLHYEMYYNYMCRHCQKCTRFKELVMDVSGSLQLAEAGSECKLGEFYS
jgi:hypothetical protein